MADGLVTIAVELQDGSVVRGVADIKNQFNGMQGATNNSSGSMTKFGIVSGIAAGIATKGLGLIVDTTKSMVGALNSSTATWKTFEGNMRIVGKSSGEIAKVKKELQSYAEQTIYSASDMASTYSQLSAVGIKNTTQLVKGFGGLAAAAEDPAQAMKTLSQQATQMAAKPMVQWEDFKLMLEQSPAGMAAVAKTMGMSTAELVKSIQKGTVATQDFFDAVSQTGTNENFTKLATEYKTTGQAMDGLTETLVNKLQPGFEQVSKGSIQAIVAITNAIDGINFQPMFNAILSIQSGLQTLVGWIAKTVQWFNSGSLAADAVKSSLVGVTAVIGAYIAITKTMSAIETVKNSIFAISFGLQQAQAVAAGTTTAALAAENAAAVGASTSFGIFNAVLGASPVLIVVGAIAALVAGLAFFFTKTETGRQAWAKFTTFLQNSLVVITASFHNFMSVTNEVFQSFKVVVVDAFNSFISFISPVITAIQSWLSSLQPVSGVFAGISGPMGVVIGLVEKFGPLIISMIAPIGLMGKLLLQFAAAFIQTGNASSAITLMASNFTELVVNVLNGLTTIINGLTAVLPSIVEAGVNIITSLINGLLGALPQIIDAATQIITMLVSAIGTALPAIIMAGVQIINMLVQAIATALPQLVEAGVQIINMLVQSFTAALPMIIESAVTIMTTLLNGIIAVLPLLIGAGLQIIMSLGQAIITALPALIDAALQIIMALVNALIVNLPQIINAGIQLLMALINGLTTVLPLLINAAIQIITALVNGLIQNLPKIIDAAVKLITALINGLIQNLPAIVSAGIKLITALAKAIIQLVPLLLKAGIQLIAALIKGILSLLGQIVQAGVRLVSQMLSRIGGFVGRMGSMGGSLIRSLISGISGMIGNVASTVSRGVSRAVSAVRGFAGDMASAAGHMASGLVNGITGKINAVVNAAKNMAKSAVNAVKSFLNIHSPSRVMRDEVGKYIPLGMAAGIDRNAGAVDDSMKSLADQVSDINPSVGVDFGIQAGLDEAKQLMKKQRYSVASNSSIELSNATKPERPIEVNNHFDNVAINDDRDIKTLAEQLAAEQTIAMRGAWG